MSTSSFNLRGLEPGLMAKIKQEAEKQNLSVNQLLLKLIEQGAGYSYEVHRPKYNDLDSLAGTWAEADLRDFEKHTGHFEKIDEDLWK